MHKFCNPNNSITQALFDPCISH